MKDYCQGSIEQVQHQFYGTLPMVHEMLAMRRHSAGVAPLFALAEYVNMSLLLCWILIHCRYALKLNLADEVFANKSIKEIERIGVDLVVMYGPCSLPII
jgi:hypothetical protein